jgi:tetratricopeptide (TPR) repeat protein
MPYQSKILGLITSLCLFAGATVYLACSPQPPAPPKADHFAMGRTLYQDKSYERAAQELTAAVEENPNLVEAHILLGLADAKLDRLDEAIAHLEVPASDEKCGQALVFTALSRLYQKKGRYDQALACAMRAKKLDPKNSDLGNLLGLAYFGQGKYNKAVKEYEKVLEKGDQAWVRNNLGLLYIETGEFDKALKQLRAAEALDPKNPKIHNNLGVVYQRLDQYIPARQHFAEAARLDPNYTRAKYNLKELETKLSKLEEDSEE